MKKRWKKPAVAAAVLLLVCAAVYMNWRYTDDIQKNAGKTLGQTTLVSSQDGEKGTEPTAAPAEDDYFATARLSRKQARDNAISMLKEAERDENAQQSVLNEASQTLQVLAAYTVAESQIESLVTAKGYADCVVFMGAESVSVVVAPPEGGLTATDAARINQGPGAASRTSSSAKRTIPPSRSRSWRQINSCNSRGEMVYYSYIGTLLKIRMRSFASYG